MSSSIPHHVQMESQLADPSTVYTPGQLRGAKMAIWYCRTIGLECGDYSRLIDRLEQKLVLTKKDRRELQTILNRYWSEWDRMDDDERTVVAWARQNIDNAYRPPEVGDQR